MAPDAVSVVDEKAQILEDAGDIVNTGIGLTSKLIVPVPIQPSALVPETVYTVVLDGVTVTFAPVTVPGFHVYEPDEPLPVNTALPPAHIAVGVEEPVIVGPLVTLTEITVAPGQPAADKPTTV